MSRARRASRENQHRREVTVAAVVEDVGGAKGGVANVDSVAHVAAEDC